MAEAALASITNLLAEGRAGDAERVLAQHPEAADVPVPWHVTEASLFGAVARCDPVAVRVLSRLNHRDRAAALRALTQALDTSPGRLPVETLVALASMPVLTDAAVFDALDAGPRCPESAAAVVRARPSLAAYTNRQGWSLAHTAALDSQLGLLRLVLELHPPAATFVTHSGMTPLHTANAPHTARLLLSAAPEATRVVSRADVTPLHLMGECTARA